MESPLITIDAPTKAVPITLIYLFILVAKKPNATERTTAIAIPAVALFTFKSLTRIPARAIPPQAARRGTAHYLENLYVKIAVKTPRAAAMNATATTR